MKIKYLFAFFVLILLVFTLGCEKDEEKEPLIVDDCGNGICDQHELTTGACEIDCEITPRINEVELDFSWSEPLLLSTEEKDSASSEKAAWDAMTIDGDIIHTVWLSVLNQESNIYYSKFDSEWTTPIQLTDTNGLYKPSIKASNGNVYLTWRDLRHETSADHLGELYFKYSHDNGDTWSSDTRLTNDEIKTALSYVNLEGDNVYIAWEDYVPDCTIKFMKSLDKGVTWEPQVQVTDGIEVGSPNVVVTDDGVLHTIYGSEKFSESTRGWNWEVAYQRSTDKGDTWGPEVRLTYDQIGDTKFPMVTASGNELHVVWWDDRDDTSMKHMGYPPREKDLTDDHNYEVYYKGSLDSGLTWGNDIRLTNTAGIAEGPSVIAQDGKVFVIWHDKRDGDDYELYLKYSINSGLSWSDDIRLTDSSADSSGSTIQIDDEGNLYIIWTEKYDNKSSDVYFMKGIIE